MPIALPSISCRNLHLSILPLIGLNPTPYTTLYQGVPWCGGIRKHFEPPSCGPASRRASVAQPPLPHF